MPMYDFRCKQCGHSFTMRASFQQKDAGLQPECPVCHAPETQSVLTAGIFIGQAAAGGSSLTLPMTSGGAGCGCGAGGCGCG
jgi:putative FmdB family regulatory protein